MKYFLLCLILFPATLGFTAATVRLQEELQNIRSPLVGFMCLIALVPLFIAAVSGAFGLMYAMINTCLALIHWVQSLSFVQYFM